MSMSIAAFQRANRMKLRCLGKRQIIIRVGIHFGLGYAALTLGMRYLAGDPVDSIAVARAGLSAILAGVFFGLFFGTAMWNAVKQELSEDLDKRAVIRFPWLSVR